MRIVYLCLASTAFLSTAGFAQSSNTADISQTGFDNRAAVENTQAGNRENRVIGVQNGNANDLTVLQIGTFNRTDTRQIGNENRIVHSQEGDFIEASSFQADRNNASAIRQRGNAQIAQVNQEGRRNLIGIAQGVEVANANFFDPISAATTRAGNDNRVTLSQVGNDLEATVRQRASATNVAAGNNFARVVQRGAGSAVAIVQESRGNLAETFQYEGGATAATRNILSVTQRSTGATPGDNPLANNSANVAMSGLGNSTTLTQDGRNAFAFLTQGFGTASSLVVSQTGSGAANRADVAQYGDRNDIVVAQNSVGASVSLWQQAGAAAMRSSDNRIEIRQGTGATGSADFSAAFFGNNAPTGAATGNLSATITQGANPASAHWNVAQVLQDGTDITAEMIQAGTGSEALPNIVRIAQQGGANSVAAIQRAGTGPSTAADSAATGEAGDPFHFAGGARSAEINILQSGSNNQASIEQEGRGQFARIEQGPGSGNVAAILQEAGATNATAVIIQTGSNNSYSVTQDQANQYFYVSQTGNDNAVSDVIQRGPGS